jgi:ligand-binding SRPBCC domain-containing protein
MGAGKIVEVASRLPAPAERVWERVSTFAGVNDELRPFLRMTAPAHVRRLDASQVVLGERLCRSWMLLFGVLPVDYDDLTLVALEPGRGFHERSRMLSMRVWEHRRTLHPDGDGCRVVDRLSFEPRVPGSGALSERVVRALFRHRHRRLRKRFGEPLAQQLAARVAR